VSQHRLAACVPERALCLTCACLNMHAGLHMSGYAWVAAGGSRQHAARRVCAARPWTLRQNWAVRTVHPHLPPEAPGAQRRVLPVVLHEAHLRAAPPHAAQRLCDAGGARWRGLAGPARTGPARAAHSNPATQSDPVHILCRTIFGKKDCNPIKDCNVHSLQRNACTL